MAKTILLIDDDADTRTYMSTILLRGGYKVRMAPDGQEGWKEIQKEKPDLILLDMMMPRRSGMHLLNEIKNNPSYKGIPIFVITGVGQMTGVDVRKYLGTQAGAETVRPELFLEKPVKPDQLLRAVREYLPS